LLAIVTFWMFCYLYLHNRCLQSSLDFCRQEVKLSWVVSAEVVIRLSVELQTPGGVMEQVPWYFPFPHQGMGVLLLRWLDSMDGRWFWLCRRPQVLTVQDC
jgi:hypothetical protein